MLTVLFINVLVFLLLSRLPNTPSIPNLLLLFLLFWSISVAYLLGSLQLSGSGIEGAFYSDEIGYLTGWQRFDIWSDPRAAWYALNYLLIEYDLSSLYALKLVNVALGLLLAVGLRALYPQLPNLHLLLIIFLPYLVPLMTSNLRDLVIFSSSVIAVLSIKNRMYMVASIMILLLLFTRPLMIPILAGCGVLAFALKSQHYQLRLKLKVFAALSVFGGLALFLTWDWIQGYLRYMDHLRVFGGEHRTVLTETTDVSQTYIEALLKSIFTPLPTSLAYRLLSGGATDWGYLHDVLRIINQSVYWGMIIYLCQSFIRRTKYSVRTLLNLDIYQIAILLFFISFAIVYSTHLAGVGHQRLKYPFQVAIFIISYLLWVSARKRNNSITESASQ